MTDSKKTITSFDFEAMKPKRLEMDCDQHGEVMHFGNERIGYHCLTCEQENKERQEKENIDKIYKVYQATMIDCGVKPNGRRFEDWQFDDKQADRQKNIIKTLQELSDNISVKYNSTKNATLPNVLLVGGTGSGKTMLANALAKAVYRKAAAIDVQNKVDHSRAGRQCAKLIKSRDITEQAKATWGDYRESEYKLIEYLADFQLLIIDDLGDSDTASNQDMAAADRGRIAQIIDKRYQKRPTVITTNLDIEDIASHLGDRAWDRLQENLIIIKCDWASYRQSVAKVAYL